MSSLEVRELSVAYGNVVVLEDINLCVEAGSVVCVLGANGAGKTSFLKSLVGLVPARTGRITWDGKDITNLKAYEAASLGVAMSPEGRRLFPDLTVYENLCVGGYLRPRDASFRSDLDRVLAYFPHLQPRLQQSAASLSGGEQQMVAVARALSGNVRLLLLDEPFEGLAPAVVQELFTVFDLLRKQASILIVEHNLDLVLALADRLFALERGAVFHQGPAEPLLTDLDQRKRILWL